MKGQMTGYLKGEMKAVVTDAVFELLKNSPEATVPEVARCLDKSKSTIERAIRKLKSEGRLSRAGANKTGNWVVTDNNDPE